MDHFRDATKWSQGGVPSQLEKILQPQIVYGWGWDVEHRRSQALQDHRAQIPSRGNLCHTNL